MSRYEKHESDRLSRTYLGGLVGECVVRADDWLNLRGCATVQFCSATTCQQPAPSSQVDNSKMVSPYNTITLALPDSQVYAHRVEFAPRQQRGLPEF